MFTTYLFLPHGAFNTQASRPLFLGLDNCVPQETFLVVTSGEGSCFGIERVEAKVAAKYPTMHRTAPPQPKIIWPKMSTVLLLRNSDLGHGNIWAKDLRSPQSLRAP